ncbi:hypothetical protein [Nocardioides sp. Root140]|uniref:hypothetical protein n=1 Tax=Nocardioides sp. Root140 TaxID=1736460 RepID=UPI0006FB2ED1|nr:hypothetical protein [Nocardioides sp. Root140]KQY61441.1 hypothetical protein ASD30_25625 [Nocardioides sp. Root140]
MTVHGDDPLDDMSRVGMKAGMVASRLLETAARAKQDQARQESARAEQRAGELQDRYQSEAVVAERYLAAATKDADWVSRTEADEVVGAWRTAAEWRELEPERFTAYAEVVDERLRSTYGLDMTKVTAGLDGDLGRAERVLLKHIEEIAAEKDQAATEDREAERLRERQRDQVDQEATADSPDVAARADAERLGHEAAAHESMRDEHAERADLLEYDSADRRAATVAEMEDAEVPAQQAAAHATADRLNAHDPKLAATNGRPVKGKSRASRAGRGQQRDRGRAR